MLDNIEIGDWIESEKDTGTVVKIIRDRWDIPVCVKVVYSEIEYPFDDGYSYVPLSKVDTWGSFKREFIPCVKYDDEYYNWKRFYHTRLSLEEYFIEHLGRTKDEFESWLTQ